ncbi:MAG: hypothetical protein QXY20_09210 [Thermofilum sp.]|uniref:hypothetical protein n=1 Tax=Thermofilum sp. TaxID=1961369 RepID=UPI00315F0198
MPRANEKKESRQAKKSSEKKINLFVSHVDDSIFASSKLVNMAIYAVLEAPQELYFGSHSERNLNVLEKVILRIEGGEGENRRYIDVEKPYYSPTKQRGVERRAIAYSIVKTNSGELKPYYKYFNLSIDVTKTYKNGQPDPRDVLTYVWGATWTEPTMYLRGRVGYGGGVAIQPRQVLSKLRNRVEYRLYDQVTKQESEESEETAQMIWSKEYVEPHILIPVYRSYMLLGVDNMEPHAVAYAFLEGLRLAGAGTPKGMSILESYWLGDNAKEKTVVVDVGTSLLPEPVVISPAIPSIQEALDEIRRKALSVQDKILHDYSDPGQVFDKAVNNRYYRLIGNTAYNFLRDLAEKFIEDYLMKIEELEIPRVKKMREKMAEEEQEEGQG